jgi:hypothetical protein
MAGNHGNEGRMTRRVDIMAQEVLLNEELFWLENVFF